MAERSYPFVDGATSDAEFSAMFRHLFPSSVLGFPGKTALAVVATSAGMQVTVRGGEAFVRGHRYLSDADQVLPIAPADSSSRVDTVILRMEYGAVQSITCEVKQGIPGAGAPSLEQTDTAVYEMPLANIAVAGGAVTIAPAAVTDRRVWWGIELMRSFGIAIGPAHPDPGSAFLSFKTP